MLDRSRFNDGVYRLHIDEILLQRIDLAIRAALEHRSHDRDEREDLVGETWERVVERWDELKDIEKAPAWSASIARRILLDRARKRSRETKAIGEAIENQRIAAGSDQSPVAGALLDSVTLAVSRLDRPQQDVVIFKYYGDLSFAEIARQTGRTKDSVYHLYQRAKQKLQDDLEGTTTEPEIRKKREQARIGYTWDCLWLRRMDEEAKQLEEIVRALDPRIPEEVSLRARAVCGRVHFLVSLDYALRSGGGRGRIWGSHGNSAEEAPGAE